MDLQLDDRVVLVTGGSDGLGAALVRSLVGEGALVAYCGRRPDRVRALAGELGARVEGVVADVSTAEGVAGFVDAATSRWGRVDGLVNNAGASAAGRLDHLEDAAWQADHDLKVMAAVRATRAVLGLLRAGGSGSVVNTLAISARAPRSGSEPSSVSRAAGLALTKALAGELGPDGIRVNAVLIGLVESGQWERTASSSGRPVADLYHEMGHSSGIPLGRVGRAEEFADLVTFLLSPRAGYITGAAINLDGGLSPVV
jgi:NAD(P)-dependent dehydrogenase (short-subunit alcohol dehydrogenase family)